MASKTCSQGHGEDIFIFVQALVTPEKFQHILRVLNTNIDGKTKIMFGLTSIKARFDGVWCSIL